MNRTCDCGSDLSTVTDVSEVACAKCRKPAGYLTSQHPAIPLPGPGHSPSMWQIERMRKTDRWIDAYGNHINLGDQVTSATTPGWPGCLPGLGDAVLTPAQRTERPAPAPGGNSRGTANGPSGHPDPVHPACGVSELGHRP